MSANFCPLMRFVFMLFDSVFLFILGVIAADDLSKLELRSFVKAFFHIFLQKAWKPLNPLNSLFPQSSGHPCARRAKRATRYRLARVARVAQWYVGNYSLPKTTDLILSGYWHCRSAISPAFNQDKFAPSVPLIIRSGDYAGGAVYFQQCRQSKGRSRKAISRRFQTGRQETRAYP